MGLSTTHLIIFLVIIVVIFGTKKLRNIGSDLGGAVKGFKEGMKDANSDKPAEPIAQQRVAGDTIELRDMQREVPVLTIALDAGFGSIGPFNRAFKADTGLTPTDFRRQALADS
jgi:sec-independent protein translocase protein TatA